MKINVHDTQKGFQFQVESENDVRLNRIQKDVVRMALEDCEAICIGYTVACPAHLDR